MRVYLAVLSQQFIFFNEGVWNMVDFQFEFSGLNGSHMRDLGPFVGGFCVKFLRAFL